MRMDALLDGSQTLAAGDTFLAFGWRQEARVDHLLACPVPRLLWFQRRQSRQYAALAEVMWSDDIVDPEFRKNLRIFRRLIGAAIALYERARHGASFEASGMSRAAELESRIHEIQQRIQLPANVPLTLKVLLGWRFTLEQLLAELGDARYLSTRAAELYAERPGTVVTWRALFREATPPLWIESAAVSDDAVELTRRMVAQLLAAKEADDLPIRARRELKQRALYLVAFIFLVATSVLSVAMMQQQIRPVLLPAVAGVTGAALGMLLKLRDELSRGSQIREFVPVSLAQLVVGATAGLFVSLISGLPVLPIADVAGPRGVAAFGFAVGFSEAAFIGLVGQIAAETKRPPPDDRPRAPAD